MMRLRNGLKMVKSENSEDEERSRIVVEELNKFNDLINGHKRLLEAIGSL